MRINDQDWSIFSVLRAFYPFQLIVAHLKHNLFSLLFWTILFLIITDNIGYSFGIPFLFLSPEYLGEVSPISFMLLGFSIGGFTMGFNTYSYIKLGPYFPFLTTIAKPFLKFSLNNALIPIAFVTIHAWMIFNFQSQQELASLGSSLLYVGSYIGGVLLFIVLSFFYFFPIAKKNKSYQMHSSKPIASVIHKREKWFDIFKKEKDRTYIYIGKNFVLSPSRSSKHFDKELVEKIYAKNRINASIFELMTVGLFFGLGAFSNTEILELPAAFSIVLLLSICLMLFSALHSWLKGWIYPLFIVVILIMDTLSVRSGLFNYTSYAYGLNYKTETDYSLDNIYKAANDSTAYSNSHDNFIKILNNWKARTNEEKPKLIILNTSGGGSRSALWTVAVMQNIDNELEGNVSKHLQFITGASGGMIGAAYYRQLLLEHRLGKIKDLYDFKYCENIGKDMLNKLAFMASTNDIFIRYKKHEVNGNKYTQDRGYAFEQQLNKNTEGKLDHSLAYYTPYERNAIIPTILLTPTIVNDGRRLLLGAQSFQFLTSDHNKRMKSINSNENVDYRTLLKKQKTGNLRFSSALRASASFPFVMPMITLPTNPGIQLMDAGIRDNYGGKTAMAMLYSMEDWIKENTSGVIILQIRDTKKILDDESYGQVSFIDKITLPFGNMYKNFPRVQDFNQDELMRMAKNAFEFEFNVVSFNLLEKRSERISLSWHLTAQEKKKIRNAINSTDNQMALEKLKKLLE